MQVKRSLSQARNSLRSTTIRAQVRVNSTRRNLLTVRNLSQITTKSLAPNTRQYHTMPRHNSLMAPRMSNVRRSVASSRAPAAHRGFCSAGNSGSFKASQLQITRAQNLKQVPPRESWVFGKTSSDHMVEIDWQASNGWGAPRIVPYHNLEIDPSASVLHYGLELFEGMKAYKDKKGALRLFRPDRNMVRMNNSAARIAFPNFDGNELTKILGEFVKVEDRWVSDAFGYSLYLRPTMISTQAGLGVSASQNVKLFVIASPVGPYYPTGWKPVNLFATSEFVRAWPGGTGNSKLGSNYCGGIKPSLDVAKKGYQQILWLFGPEDNVTEGGTMNMLIYWINEEGEKELRTAPLDGTILPGVTRESILELSREWGEFKVSEKPWNMGQVQKALQEGRVFEAFGAGTAAIVSSVASINYKGNVLKIPVDKSNPDAGVGPLAKRFADHLMGIQYGEIPHPWSYKIE